MHKQTSLVAKQVRLQEWVSHIQACQSRPKGMTIQQWCDQNGIIIHVTASDSTELLKKVL